MYRISGIHKKTHNLITGVVRDYYGVGFNERVAKMLMGKKVPVDSVERSDIWRIQENMKDAIYLSSFINTSL